MGGLEEGSGQARDESDTPGSTIAELIKWSYADSPYCCFRDESFDDVNVEVMPPDEINTEIALRLNRTESPAMQAWLAEAAE
ncbi:hypothetical protein HPL003_07090 [Paenibacillus terrae HPL-003]|uniref:Uncharacterized protein n=1 Tax=Paenibacillus terrae (strain HPL-003) TaxID=985665 RepID=G7VTX1_PAETH|nr:DUF4303 domain-containing protein [Paenibacillus terrae]AET58181.1 hypothetical protein HPL003_07090 [Paenibacillus terrae HPL-003]